MTSIYAQPLDRSQPEEQGVLSGSILSFIEDLEAKQFWIHSFMLMRHARVIAEGWWSPYEPDCKRYLYSLSKSFTSTAVGLAVTEGLLNVEDKVISFFPDDLPPVISENLAAMRVKDLLTMSTGHAMDTLMILFTPGLENWVQAILSLPVEFKPGTHFLYNSGATYLLSAIVQKVTGQTVMNYLTPRLFEPLGITGMTWDVCPRGINTGGWGLSVRTQDIARFGLLYAQKGSWNGKQLLPAAWVEEATAFSVRNDAGEREKEPLDWKQGYGYQFWRCQHGAYRGDGAYGQYCVVMPDQDAVLAMTSETADMQGIMDLVWQHLLPGMKDAAVPGQTAAQELLRKKLSSLHIAIPAKKIYPVLSARISGKQFILDPNKTGIQTISFNFDQDCCTFKLRDGRGDHQIVCGNGKWVANQAMLAVMSPTLMSLAFNQKSQEPVKLAATGTWADPETFVITWQFLESPHFETLSCHFIENKLQLEVTRSIGEPVHPALAGKEHQFSGKLG